LKTDTAHHEAETAAHHDEPENGVAEVGTDAVATIGGASA
jgi:hypothetical protein